MSILDRIPLTNLRCMQLAPDGRRCLYRTDDQIRMEQHADDHGRCERGVIWDNCQICRYPIRLTKADVLRKHGPPAQRCEGSGLVGRFILRCRGELE